MPELTIRLDVSVNSRLLRGALALAILATAAPELGSETVTLSTYYPAPSGVYTRMITTGNTFLARDGASMVGIGTASPTERLTVNGNILATGSITGGNFTATGNGVFSRLGVNTAAPTGNTRLAVAGDSSFTGGVSVAQNNYVGVGQAYLSSGGGYLHLGHNAWYGGAGGWTLSGSGALLQMESQNVRFYSHNGSAFTQTVMIGSNGHIVAFGGSSCSVTSYSTTGTTYCPGGTYAAAVGGLMSKYTVMPLYRDIGGQTAQGLMLCCSCPSGSCPSL